MRRAIKIGKKKEIKINTSWSWAYIYQDYFGHDIIPDLVPLIDTFIETLSGLINGSETDEEDLGSKLYGMEITTVTNVIWALAKNADDSIPEVREWLDGFDEFPLDIILPEVLDALAGSMMSTKKAELLRGQLEALALRFIQSASPQQTGE